MNPNQNIIKSTVKKHNIILKYQPLTAGDHEVFIAGSFNQFNPQKDKFSEKNGIYEISLSLPEGKYQYKFVVDGLWVIDEKAEEYCADGFGGQNSIFYAGDPNDVNNFKKIPIICNHKSPDARIYIAGNFNNWNTDSDRLAYLGNDTYGITLLLRSGEYKFKLLINDKWTTCPYSDGEIADGFGGLNSIIKVDERFEKYTGCEDEIFYFGLNPHELDEIINPLEEDLVEIKLKAYHKNVLEINLIQAEKTYIFEKIYTYNDFDYFQLTLNRNHLPVSSQFFFVFKASQQLLKLYDDGFFPENESGTKFKLNWDELSPFLTPQWVKEGIIYQIFPDRFCNGNPRLNQNFKEWYYKGKNQLPESGKIEDHEEFYHFVEDWYDIEGLRKSSFRNDGKPDVYSFYGGDLAGIKQKLNYLQDLGITIIYFNPLFEACSNHKYDAMDYKKIDPHFGTNEEFKIFTRECHQRGIRIILDVAFNHMGNTSQPFQDALKKGNDSHYFHWFEWKKWPLPKSGDYKPSDYYSCWWGFGNMPELDYDLSRNSKDENALTELNKAKPNWDVIYYILSVAEFWLLEMGIDGFRLDVPNEVPFWFWKLFRNKVKNIKPDAYIVAEIWHNASQWVNNDYCDAVMNYAFFKDPVIRFFNLRKSKANDFVDDIRAGLLTYPRQASQVMMNLLDSHDTYRFLEIADNDYQKLKLAVLFQMTFIGTPHIWYGDEIGMRGSFDPDCRRPFNWKYEQDNKKIELRDFYRKLIRIRKKNKVLIYGTFKPIYTKGMILVYERSHNDVIIWVVINNSNKKANIEIPVPRNCKQTKLKSLLDNKEICFPEKNLKLNILPYNGYIYKFS